MIASVDNPYRSPLRWDYVECAGVVSPGVIPHGGVSGFKRVYSFDQKNGYGMFGSIPTFAFRPAATGSIRIWTWTEEQFDAMPAFLSVLEYDPTKAKVQAIDIGYPSLAALGIRRVVTTGIAPPRHLSGKKYEWEIDLIEFRPPPKISAVSTPVATKKKPAEEDDPDLAKQIEALNPQYQKALGDAASLLQ